MELQGTSVPSERRRYLFRQMAGHLYDLVLKRAAGAANDLFALVEKPGFLSRQAEVCSGFEQSGEDLEQRALPAAIEAGEWDRFLHFALLAINLRGLAEAMAEGPVLRALARADRFDLAEDAVARLSDPARRAAALASLAAACTRGGERFRDFLLAVDRDLEPWSVSGGTAPPLDSLCAVARQLSPDLAMRWPAWLERLAGDAVAARRLAWAVAEGYLEQGKAEDPGLWSALAAVDPDLLCSTLPERLGALDLADPGPAVARLRDLLGPAGAWPATARLLARLAESCPDRALAAWEERAAAEPVPWSAELAEAGWDLFRRLPAERLEEMAGRCDEGGACAALRVLALVAAPNPEREAAALAAVSALPDRPVRLHWALRYLEARAPGPETERQLGAVLAYLRELRYDADPGDVARFLDLAARAWPPKAVAREVEDAVFSPAGRPDHLRALCERATAEPVLLELLEHAERYAAVVAPTEAEGFLLRGELIQRVARRLCGARRDLAYLARAVEHLLPEEEDDLRAALAADLAAAGAPDLARQVAERIRAPRRRLASLLPGLPAAELGDRLGTPAQRYRTLASVEKVEGERLALAALLEAPFDPRELVERWLTPIRDREQQTAGLLRLAWHALAYEQEFHRSRQDRAAVLELVRASLAVASNDRLVALTPQIATLGAQRGGAHAVAEFQEAARRLLGLTGVAWPLRRAALEDLLARLRPVFLPAGERRRACGQAAEVLRAVLRLPMDLEPEPAREELRRHWDQVLPLVLAALDRLPGRAAQRLAEIPRVWPEWESWAAGNDLPPGWRQTIELCLKGSEEWGRAAAPLVSEPSPDPAPLPALVYLLSRCEPQQAVRLLQRLPAGTGRDGLCLRLLRHGWLATERRSLLAILDAPDLRLEAEIASPLPDDDRGHWLADLAALVARRGVDPCAPADEPLLARLWSCAPCASRQPLAEAAVLALRTAGRERGETAVRLWLHAHLAPLPGRENRAGSRLAVRAQMVLEQARALPGSDR